MGREGRRFEPGSRKELLVDETPATGRQGPSCCGRELDREQLLEKPEGDAEGLGEASVSRTSGDGLEVELWVEPKELLEVDQPGDPQVRVVRRVSRQVQELVIGRENSDRALAEDVGQRSAPNCGIVEEPPTKGRDQPKVNLDETSRPRERQMVVVLEHIAQRVVDLALERQRRELRRDAVELFGKDEDVDVGRGTAQRVGRIEALREHRAFHRDGGEACRGKDIEDGDGEPPKLVRRRDRRPGVREELLLLGKGVTGCTDCVGDPRAHAVARRRIDQPRRGAARQEFPKFVDPVWNPGKHLE